MSTIPTVGRGKCTDFVALLTSLGEQDSHITLIASALLVRRFGLFWKRGWRVHVLRSCTQKVEQCSMQGKW